MRIVIELQEDEFTEKDKEIIKESLNITNDTEFDSALSKIAKSALMEYKKMFIEKGLPTRADEVQQERLYFLLTNYYGNRLPSESEISSIFQLTHSQSKTLLKNTRSRYRTKIQSSIIETLRRVVENAEESDGVFKMVIQSDNVKEELNLLISQKGPKLNKLVAVRGSAGQFCCPEDTYDLLKRELGIP